MATIELKHIAHSYDCLDDASLNYALKPLDLVWEHGQTYALLGPSGCGKTTLLNIISGLITPSEGQVLFDDNDVTNIPTALRNIAQVFQFPVNYDTMTVLDNLAFPLINKGDDRKEAYKRAEEIAEILDLRNILHEKAEGLSADLKQLVSLGRGLVRKDVNAILFDEPLTVIDPARKWHLRSKIKEIQRQFNHTMIYVTHDQTEALTFADHVVVMEAGMIRQIGSPKELFERPQHTFVGYFIGSPGMNIVPVSIEDETAKIGSHPLDIIVNDIKDLTNIELGIRPEFIELNTDGTGIPLNVDAVENIGKHQIIRGNIDGHTINTIAPSGLNLPDKIAFITFNNEFTMLYQNGELIKGVSHG